MLSLVLFAACAPIPQPSLRPDAEPVVVTADGWTLPLRHYGADGPPVLLVHGMGVDHNNWDFRDDVSLASWLRARGWDVWVPALRGDAGTVPPPGTVAWGWTFEDHARRDLPAIVDLVLGLTGAPKLAWVGHSMGGMLLYAALGLYPERISAGVAVASPAAFTTIPPLYRAGAGVGFLTDGAGRLPTRGLSPLVAVFGRHAPFLPVLANPANLDIAEIRGLGRVGLHGVPYPMAREALAWVHAGALVDAAGDRWVRPSDVPVLVMGGSVDKLVPWQNVAAACDVYPDCRFQLLGTAGGLSVEYGHIDPVVGRSAPAEVYPLVDAFLAAHARPDTGRPDTGRPDTGRPDTRHADSPARSLGRREVVDPLHLPDEAVPVE
jgi:pimeloyl-ACP methyl ester carboxylesterase